jgi:hypothetical protein
MRLRITINAMAFEIDSTDPITLGRWVVEILARMERTWSPATIVTVQTSPTWVMTDNGNDRPDWIADGRVLGNFYEIRTPQDLVNALQQQLRELEALLCRDT